MNFSEIFAWVRVTSSEVSQKTGAVLLTLSGAGYEDDPNNERGEGGRVAPMLQSLGVIGRPLRDSGRGENYAEAVAARSEQGEPIPLAFRDRRILEMITKGQAAGSFPKEGQIVYAGYGGSFLSFETTDEGQTGSATLYVPFDRDADGVPQKAHVVTVDPENESIMLVASAGSLALSLSMDPDNGIMMRADDSTWLRLKPGKFEVVAATSSIQGNVALGANTLTAAPVAPALATLASPSVYLSLV